MARRTPVVATVTLDETRWCFKCENLQPAGAFKIRGAYHMVSRLPPDVRARGVITFSSGNHGQAVALAARLLGVPAVIVMPTTAAPMKVAGARQFGAEVVFEGTTSLERQARAEREAAARGLAVVPPFDHEWIIAGQGTAGLEILEQRPTLGCVLVPVGGGGLLAGIAAAVKSSRPDVRVVGVEPAGASRMSRSLAAGHPVTLERTASIADGLLPVRPGDLTFAHAKAFVDEVITVEEGAIAKAVLWAFRQLKMVVEPSGAATIAALLSRAERVEAHARGADVVAVLSGGNMAPERLMELVTIAEEAGEPQPAPPPAS